MSDIDWTEQPAVRAAKRLGIQQPMWMGDDWFTSWSPRNDNNNAEGPWCQWVHLARLILSDDRTRLQMPDHYREYWEPPHIYDEHHPECVHRERTTDDPHRRR